VGLASATPGPRPGHDPGAMDVEPTSSSRRLRWPAHDARHDLRSDAGLLLQERVTMKWSRRS
jgi:hypothetical protein